MSRMDDIAVLLEVADELLARIRTEYEESLKGKAVNPTLTVHIKNYFENLRSPLDYVASEICETILSTPRKHKTYFPITCENPKAFATHVAKYLPGLVTAHSELHAALEAVQPYGASHNTALPKLSKLVNENKHNRLSPQTRTEKKGLNIQFPGGAGISMPPGASISGGGMISSGGGWVSPAGGTISGDSPARVGSEVTQTITMWVSFTFEETGDDVIRLLETSRSEVGNIVERVRPFL